MTAVERTVWIALATAPLVIGGCEQDRPPAADEPSSPAEERVGGEAVALWREVEPGVVDEAARFDTMWRAAPSVDSVRAIDLRAGPVMPADSAVLFRPELPDSMFEIPESWDDLAVDSVWTGNATRVIHFPLGGRVAGPSVLKVQVLLDRAGFSPGVLDGRWGGNVERAVFWFQRREALRPTGRVDSLTLERIRSVSGEAPLVAFRTLGPEDVEGPFTEIPADVYARDDLDCLCPEAPIEKIAERAHTTPEVLRRLNPAVDFESIAAGDSIRVPVAGFFHPGSQSHSPRRAAATADPAGSRADSAASPAPNATTDPGAISRIVVSDRGRYLHAFDAAGHLVLHAPATLGSDYNPSPEGRLEVTSVTFDPWFHYQPALLEGADPGDPATRLAPGPNSPVGTVWIALSREHYGIHGTNAPETIGYATSSGCVRLTNWDAERLARMVSPGTTVQFRDIRDGVTADPAAAPGGAR